MKDLAEWKADQEITYTVVVKINDTDIYYEEARSGDSACEAIGRAENYVERRLNEDYDFEKETLEDEALELSTTAKIA